MAELMRVDGFEHGVSTPPVNTGDLSLYSALSGTVCTVQSSIKRSGNYALRINKAAMTSTYLEWEHFIRTETAIIVSFYIYFTSFPDTQDDDICFSRPVAGVVAALKINYTTKKIFPRFWGTSSGTPVDVVLTTGQWYRIDMMVDVSTGTHTIDFQVDGTAGTQHTLSQAATTINSFGFGSTNTNTFDVYYDDLIQGAKSSDYPYGEHSVIGLRPDSDGSHNAGTNIIEDNDGFDIGAVTAYDHVDENPWTSTDADYIKQVATGDYYAEINFANTGYSTVLGASGLLQYNSSGVTLNAAACSITDEDTLETEIYGTSSSRRNYAITTLAYRTRYLPNPSGGWDAQAVNALKARCGYASNVSSVPYWHAIMLQVAVSGSESGETLSINISPEAGTSRATGVRIYTP